MFIKLEQIEHGEEIKAAADNLKKDVETLRKKSAASIASINKIRKELSVLGWDDARKQTVTDDCIYSDSLVLMTLPPGTPDDVSIAFFEADIRACEQADGAITFEYAGTRPAQTFIVELYIL